MMNLNKLLFRSKDRSIKKELVVSSSEGNVNNSLEIHLPTIEEDAAIWRRVGEEYFKIPGVIRKVSGGKER